MQESSRGIRKFRKDHEVIFWGDALDVLESEIEESSIHLIFADPPYNIGKRFGNFKDTWKSDADYSQWCEKWLRLCLKKLTPHGSMYVMSSTQCIPYLDLYLRDKLHIASRIVWHYDSSGVQAKSKFGSMYEPILFCTKDSKHYTFNTEHIKVEAPTGAKRGLIDYRKPIPTPYNTMKVPGNVWYFPRVRYRMPEYENHPTQKPIALLERIILASSNPGDTVLDPFSGTFTTSVVAKANGRKSIGIEQEGEYIKIGLRRLMIQEELDGQKLSPVEKDFSRKKGRQDLEPLDTLQRTLFDEQ